ncbi:MAG TPA: fumarylacetoacetate hydrolase family protein [Casimicrobiaceae bacterium]|nr:fumarylacetoacetate hydrolase family protein [Casimicrobiaceae bacterium]
MRAELTPSAILPADHDVAILVGRAFVPAFAGPAPVLARADGLYDLSAIAPTTSELFARDDAVAAITAAMGTAALPKLAALDAALANSDPAERDAGAPWLLAPCDWQPIKASGVTFVASMLERVIEEQARGDPARAEATRRAITAVIGDNLARVVPGSPEAAELKRVLVEGKAWSQYLEVGIGPDAEVFTKCAPLSAVGVGADIGVLARSTWNNPEPEIVLAVAPSGRTVGATLGNDVNLRDFEGRSALLLGKAKDNNASCAIGPFVRLFDDRYGIDDVRRADIALNVTGEEGFVLDDVSSMAKISRDPLDLVKAAMGPEHQYPDGVMLFLGTMFAPTKDRFAAGQGFTHAIGDIVRVSTPTLGTLVNRVDHCHRIEPWTFGAAALARSLSRRGVL